MKSRYRLMGAMNRLVRGGPAAPETPSIWRTPVTAVPVRAYVNHGRWVADCIRPHCGGAELLRRHQSVSECFECHLVTPVEWPPDAGQIWEALMERPVPATRNWFPVDHPVAVRAGCPHGQSVVELYAEAAEHENELMPGGAAPGVEGGTSWRGLLH